MSLAEDLHTQEALDEAIKLLYQSRPAKAAALLGLVDPANPISLAPKVEAEKVSAQLSGQPILNNPAFNSNSGFNSIPVKQDRSGKIGDLSSSASFNVDRSGGPAAINSPRPEKTISIAKGDGVDSAGVASSRGERTASLRKQAMTDEEYLMYQAGMGPMMEHTGDPSLTPTQLAAMGGGTVAVAGTNRMRAKNVAGRELKQIRKQYLNAVRDQALTRRNLRNLNRELKLRGAKPSLRMAPTVGIADAHMARAEKDLTGKVLKNRYRGALPLLAAGLIGTLAYNKLNEA